MDEIVARTRKDLARVGVGCHEVLSLAAKQEVETVRADNHVVARFTAQEVVAERIFDDVVALAAVDLVGLHAGVEVIVAAVAPQRIDAFIAVDRVISLSAAEDDVLTAEVLQDAAMHNGMPIGIRAAIHGSDLAEHLVAHQCRLHGVVPSRIETFGVAVVVLLRDQSIELEDHVGHRHRECRQMRGMQITQVGVAHDDVGERICLEEVEQVHALRTTEVIEPVAVLQVLHLIFEDEVEGRAELAAELHQLLSQTADPHVDGVDAAEASNR